MKNNNSKFEKSKQHSRQSAAQQSTQNVEQNITQNITKNDTKQKNKTSNQANSQTNNSKVDSKKTNANFNAAKTSNNSNVAKTNSHTEVASNNSHAEVASKINNTSAAKTNSHAKVEKTNSQTDVASGLNTSAMQNNLKTEKQKQAEVANGGKQAKSKFATSSLSRNIIIVFVVLIMSFVSVASVALAGNFPKTVVIASNEINTRIAQAKLAELGYFDGTIDGIFDDETVSAIKEYQKSNGLTQTGSLDQVTAAAIGVTDNTQANTDLYLLAKLIHSEARGEPYEGQVAVGAVVLNRVDDAGFPNTLQGVIYQPWAFTALHDGQFNLEPTSTSYQAAQDALNGWDPSYGCLYYYNPATATSSWIFSRQTIVVIGNHVFCI